MIDAQISGLNSFSLSENAFELYEKSSIGEKNNGKITYSPFETLFLMEKGKMTLFEKNKIISSESYLKKARKHDKRFQTKYSAFKNLRDKGHIVKTALKFGIEFRVYKRGSKPGKEHAPWLVHPIQEHELLSWHDFAAKNRIAVTTNKKVILAIVDDEHDVIYYEISWFKP